MDVIRYIPGQNTPNVGYVKRYQRRSQTIRSETINRAIDGTWLLFKHVGCKARLLFTKFWVQNKTFVQKFWVRSKTFVQNSRTALDTGKTWPKVSAITVYIKLCVVNNTLILVHSTCLHYGLGSKATTKLAARYTCFYG